MFWGTFLVFFLVSQLKGVSAFNFTAIATIAKKAFLAEMEGRHIYSYQAAVDAVY